MGVREKRGEVLCSLGRANRPCCGEDEREFFRGGCGCEFGESWEEGGDEDGFFRGCFEDDCADRGIFGVWGEQGSDLPCGIGILAGCQESGGCGEAVGAFGLLVSQRGEPLVDGLSGTGRKDRWGHLGRKGLWV